MRNSRNSNSKAGSSMSMSRNSRVQASNQFMSNTSINFKSIESANTYSTKPDTAKITVPETYESMKPPQTAPYNIEAKPASLTASSEVLSSQLSQINDQLNADQIKKVSTNEAEPSPAPQNDIFGSFDREDHPKQRYAIKHQLENHVGQDFFSSSVLGGPLQRDEKQIMAAKKEEQQRQMKEALLQQMEEKKRQKEKENDLRRMEMEQFERRVQLQQDSPLKVEPEEPSQRANDIFSPPKTSKTADHPSPPNFQVPSLIVSPPRSPGLSTKPSQLPSPPRTVKTYDSPSPPRFNMPTSPTSTDWYQPPRTVPAAQDNSEECIEYLNLLCHQLMEKQHELQNKVVSQEQEIQNLQSVNSQPQPMKNRVQNRPRPVPKSATAAPTRKNSSERINSRNQRIKVQHAEQNKKIKAIEDKIENARLRREQAKLNSRVCAPQIPRSRTQQARPMDLKQQHTIAQTRSAIITPEVAMTMPLTPEVAIPMTLTPEVAMPMPLTPEMAMPQPLPPQNPFAADPRQNLDSAGTSHFIYPTETGGYQDELDKFLTSNHIGNHEDPFASNLQIQRNAPPRVIEGNYKVSNSRKGKFPRDVFRVIRN